MARELVITITVEAEKAKAELAEFERRLRANERAFTEGRISVEKYEAQKTHLAQATARTRAELDKLTTAQKGSIATTVQATTATSHLVDLVKRYAGPAAIGYAIKSTIDWAGALQDLSGRTGLSTEALQRLGVVAQKNGSSMEALATSIQMMGDRLYSGDKSAVKAVKALGLNLEELLKLDPEQAFRKLAAAVAAVEDPMRKNALVVDLFGRSGRSLIPVLDEIAQNLDQDIPAASAETIRRLDQLGDAWTELKHTVKVAIASVIGTMMDLNTWLQNHPIVATIAVSGNPMMVGQQGYAFGQELGAYLMGQGIATPPAPGSRGLRTGAAFEVPGTEEWFGASGFSQEYRTIVRDLDQQTRALNRSLAAEAKEAEQAANATGKLSEGLTRLAAMAPAIVPATLVSLGGFLGQQAASLVAPGRLGGAAAGGGAGWGGYSTLFGGTKPTGGWASTLFQGVPVTGPAVRSGWSGALPGQALGVQDIIGQGPGFWGRAFGNAGGFAGGLSQTIMGAFMGGGSVGQGVGGFLAGNVGAALVSGIGGTLGSVLGSIVPGLGTMLGGALGGWIGNLFGGAGRTRQMRNQWIEAAGGLAEVRRMADYAGVSIEKLLNTKKTKEFEKEVRKLEAAYAATQKRVEALITELGTLAQQGGLVSNSLAQRILTDINKPEVAQAFQQFVEENLGRATEGLTRYLEAARGLPMTTRSAQALGAALAGIWQQSRALGATAREALVALLPAIKAFEARLREAGLSGGAAFAELRQQAAWATDAIIGPLLEGVDGLTEAMIGLANAGLLTEEMFRGLAEQVGLTYQRLIRQGLSAEDALRAIAPGLQRIWELQQKFGWAVDDATQALINQGVEAGLVGEHMKGTMEQILQVLKAIAKALGADIPEAARRADEAIGRIRPPRWADPGEGGGGGMEPGQPPAFQFGSGGVRDFGPGTLAVLHGREAVLTDAQLRSLVEGRGAGTTINITIQALDTQSVRTAVEQDIAPQLVEVLRQNVRGLRTNTQYALGVR